MGIFEEFDNAVDSKALEAATKKARENSFPEIPKGEYEVQFTKIEMTTTKKAPKKPMLSITAKILDGKYKNSRIFMNRVLKSDKGVEATGSLIQGAESWLYKLEAEDEDGQRYDCMFKTYSQFAEMVEEIMEAVEDMELTYLVAYDPDAFNTISIKNVL